MKGIHLLLLLLGIFSTIFDGYVSIKYGNIQNKMLSRSKLNKSALINSKLTKLPSRVVKKSQSLESSTLSSERVSDSNESTIGKLIGSKNIILNAPKKKIIKPLNAKIESEDLRDTSQDKKKGSIKVRSISPRRITIVELDMGPQEMVKPLSEEAKKLEESKDGINMGSAELACGRYSFMFHCEITEVEKQLLEKKKDRYLYYVKNNNNYYVWNTSQGSYGRVVFGYIEVPFANQKFTSNITNFSKFYKLPKVLTGVKVLYHGGGKYSPKYLLPGMKISVVIKSYFRGLYRIGRLVWNREREILHSLSREFWTDGAGNAVTHTPTVFSIHYQDLETNKQEILFQDQENRKALVSELLIMERIRGQTFFELAVYLQGEQMMNWLEKNNAWELWAKAIYKLLWTLIHLLQSFMLTGYILYMHCDLNRSNILISMPELTYNHRRNLLNIISINAWDMRLIDLSFVWAPSSLKSRNTNGVCSQVNKNATFSDSNYMYLCLIELLKIPQKDLPVSKPSPLYKSIREKSIKFWELLDSIKEWSFVGLNFIGRNPSIHSRYKIKRPDLKGNAFNECIEGMMLMSDLYDSKANLFGIKLNYNSFSPEAYLRGYLHLSFRITKLGLCIRTQIQENWESLKNIIFPISYFDFSILTLNFDANLKEGKNECTIKLPSNEDNKYNLFNLPLNICESIKNCMSNIESLKSIPGDRVIKPAIAIVTAENHESDSFLSLLRNQYKFPESIQSIGSRLFGRFQGLKFPNEFKEETIIQILLKLRVGSEKLNISHPSEKQLLYICDNMEKSNILMNIIGEENYKYLIEYAENYKLNKFCQLLFKILPNTFLFSKDKDLSNLTVSTILPSRKLFKKSLDNSVKVKDKSLELKHIEITNKKYNLKDEIFKIKKSLSGNYTYLFTPNHNGIIKENINKLFNNEFDIQLKNEFINKYKKIIDSVNENILKYKSIQLFCTVLNIIFDCKVNIKKKENYDNNENETSKIDDISNMKLNIWSEKHNDMFEIQWKIFNGKYGSVAFVNVLIPNISDEILIKSHILVNSNNMPMKLKNIRAWFHGNSMINAGWIPENTNFFLVVKSPFNGVHTRGKELWERENKISLLLNRDNFSITYNNKDSFQISPSIVTFHSNSKSDKKVPTHFFLSRDSLRIVKLNDSYRPLFSNYMFMEYIDGYPLDLLLYYLRSEKLFNWLNNNKNNGWKLWLGAILNLLMLVLHLIQSFSSSGYFLYMHCDLNFGNLLIMKEVIDSENGSIIGKILDDKDDHETNLKLISNLKYDSIRIIDFSFTYIFHHKESNEELLEIQNFIKNKGIHKIIGERNFENICKNVLKAALFNDPNYIAIILSEIIKGYSILYNQVKIYNESLELNANNNELNIISPLEKWNDSSNPYINFLSQFYSSLDNINEWNEISLEFIENEQPIERWISKKKRNNQRNILSSFNQGIEAYLKLCDKTIQFIKISEKAGLTILNKFKESNLNFNCFSIESYMRSYLFLSYNVVKIGSCIRKRMNDIPKLYQILKKSNSYFEFSILVVSYYIWLLYDNKFSNKLNSKILIYDFYSELKSNCGIEVINTDFVENIDNIDDKFNRTKEIYKEIFEDQNNFIFNSIYKYDFIVPIGIFFQRTWYRIQELPELISKRIPSTKILNIIVEIFKMIQSYILNFEKKFFYSEDEILNLCLKSVKDKALDNILKQQLFEYSDLNLVNEEFCHLIIKPTEYIRI